MAYVLAVDGGGTRTLAVVANLDGKILSTADAGPANIHATSLDDAFEALKVAAYDACWAAGIGPGDIGAACFGLAGAGRPEDQKVYCAMLRRLSLACSPKLLTDGEIALDAATRGGPGVILISGTGSVCLGRGRDGRILRSGGHGPVVGDEGSGYDIGRNALSAGLRAADGRGAPTLLSEVLSGRLGAGPIHELPVLLRRQLDRPAIAALAHAVLDAAYVKGDAVALGIAARAASDIAELALSVISRLGCVVPVHLSGGVFAGSPAFAREVSSLIGGVFPETCPNLLEIMPVAGAFWHAVHELGEGPADLSGFRFSSMAGRLADGGQATRDHATADHATADHAAGHQAAADPPAGDYAAADPAAPEQTAPAALPVTEHSNPRSQGLGSMASIEIVRLMNSEDACVAPAVGKCLAQVARAVDWAAESLRRGGRLVYVGAGTSGRLATLDAAECTPTFGMPPGKVIAVIAGGASAVTSSVEGAEDDEAQGTASMDELGVCPLDTVVGIAASGSTPFTVAAVKRAKQLGAKTVALTSAPGSVLAEAASLAICPVVGPEILTGSTRLKSGTSHKMVLNMISTGAMVLCGKAYGNWMVDLEPSNQKLRARAVRIVAGACGVDQEQAAMYLDAADNDVKAAVTAALAGVRPGAARDALSRCEGFVDRAVKYLKNLWQKEPTCGLGRLSNK